MDFMSADCTYLVPFELVPVEKDAYPHWQDQRWAEADDEVATRYMLGLLDAPEVGRALGERASLHIRLNSTYRATGLRYANRLDQINV
jgi:hypothetical protein